LGPRALRRWQVLAGSLDPNPHGDMASATQRTPSITRTRRAVSGPKPSRYAEVELHRFGRRSSALDLPSSGCGLASSPKLGGRILGGAKIGGIPFAAGPCEASPTAAAKRRPISTAALSAPRSTDGCAWFGRAIHPACRVGHDRQPAPRAFRRAARKVLRIRHFGR
jgi:hypothetical protein